MEPFDEDVYVPILLAKQGERSALADTPRDVADGLRPMFVIPRPDWNYEEQRPKKSIADHIVDLPSKLAQTWGTGDAFVDAQQLEDAPVFDGDHPLFWLVRTAADFGLRLTPVVRITDTDRLVEVVADVATEFGACIRLGVEHWPAGGSTNDLDELLSDIGLQPSETHMVLDMGDDVGTLSGRAVLAELRTFPYLDEWASLTVASTALPSSMPAGGSTIHTIGRADWRIYQALCTQRLPRVPTFGDYGVQGPDSGPDIDPRVLSMSATIRYTVADNYLVSKGLLYKGSGGRSLGGSAVPPAAQALLDHDEYMGDDHCGMEAWLREAARGTRPGNGMTWRRYGTLHHLHTVSEQVSNQNGP